MKVLVIDNYDSFTYNLVQYLGELGAEVDVVRNDRATVAELLERGADRLVISPGPCTPADAGISIEASRAFPEAGRADARRLPRPPGDGRGVRRAGRPRRAGPRQGRGGRARRATGSSPASRHRCAPAATTRSSPTPTCPTRSR